MTEKQIEKLRQARELIEDVCIELMEVQDRDPARIYKTNQLTTTELILDDVMEE
jgi:hypothetical protein